MQKLKKGLVYVFTGDGKGKTSTAFWTGVRAALRGMKVAAVQWYKEAAWPTAEQKISQKLPNFKVYLMGKGFYKLPTDHATGAEHKRAAEEALVKAKSLVGKVDMLILDEVNNVIADRLIKVSEVIEVIERRGKTHIIITGRKADKDIIALADLVTEMKKIKHPFDTGRKAIRGLDY